MQPGRPGAALAVDTGEPEWCAYSGALGRKFLRLDPLYLSAKITLIVEALNGILAALLQFCF